MIQAVAPLYRLWVISDFPTTHSHHSHQAQRAEQPLCDQLLLGHDVKARGVFLLPMSLTTLASGGAFRGVSVSIHT